MIERPIEPITIHKNVLLPGIASEVFEIMREWGYHRSAKKRKYALRVPPALQRVDQPRMDICSVGDMKTLLRAYFQFLGEEPDTKSTLLKDLPDYLFRDPREELDYCPELTILT